MRVNRVLRLLVGLLVAGIALSGCSFKGAYDLPLPGKVVSGGDGYRVTADFADVVNVVPRTVVMANDVPVGQVESVERAGWHARVVMLVRKDIVLPANATADVRQTSLLGEKYIQLAAPQGAVAVGKLANGAKIPLSRTSRNPEVEEVLGALSFLLSGGGVGQLKTISSELNKMMNGRQDDVRGLLTQLNATVGALDDQKDDIIRAMESINKLTATLNTERKTVGAALDSFGPALRVLNEQHQSLIKLLKALDRLGVVGTRVIGQSKDNIVTTLRHLQPTLRQLANAGDSLPRGLMMLASFPFPKQAADLARGDYSNALFDMNFDLDKALRGTLKGGDTGLPNIDQLCAVYAGTGSCAQLMSALCSVLHTNVFCAPLGTGVSGGAKSGVKKPANQNPLGGVTGGLLGGLFGGSTTSSGSGSTAGSGSGGGLLGLLGGGQ